MTIRVGQISRFDPIPDGPRTPSLYYAYDDVDSLYPERPQFNWQELRGTGTHVTYRRDSSVTVDLPFTFNYYGHSYHQISICNNGFIVPGASSYCVRDNARLPAGAGVPMLAVNWDAIAPMLGNGVWYQNDPAGHRFIVEWDSMVYRTAADKFEKFEIVIYDSTVSAHWGQSVFQFQYLTANLYQSSTVGIQDQSLDIGITALYSTHYDRASAHIAPGRAIKFTTNAPYAALAEPKTGSAAVMPRFAFSVKPNPFRDASSIRLSLPIRTAVDLRIYDASGRTVRDLATGIFPAGQSQFSWDGRDRNSRTLPAGIYFCRVVAGATARTLPIVLTR
jgi:hypothetical protein